MMALKLADILELFRGQHMSARFGRVAVSLIVDEFVCVLNFAILDVSKRGLEFFECNA
jgi:hypothetical protein